MITQKPHPEGVFSAILCEASSRFDRDYKPFWWLRFLSQHGTIYKCFGQVDQAKADKKLLKRLFVGATVKICVRHVEIKGEIRPIIVDIAVRSFQV